MSFDDDIVGGGAGGQYDPDWCYVCDEPLGMGCCQACGADDDDNGWLDDE